jgi:hypothetical protein
MKDLDILLIKKGYMKHLPDELFDPEQLRIGMEIEKEHTSDPEETKKIAKDHLVEFPDYYTRLKKMEADAKKDGPISKYLKAKR